jgi:hypothetical protein
VFMMRDTVGMGLRLLRLKGIYWHVGGSTVLLLVLKGFERRVTRISEMA